MTDKQSTAPKVVAQLPKALVVADLNKAIDSVIKDANDIQDRIQTVGVQSLMHLKAHGDIGPINRLFLGLAKGVRRNALASWFLAYGALEVNLSADTRKAMPMKYSKAKQTYPEGAVAEPWYTHLPEKDISDVFDLQKAIHGLLVRAKGKTIVLHGKTMSVEHAADTLKTLATMAGEEGYKPDVNQEHGGKALTEPPAPGSPPAPAEAAAASDAKSAAAVTATVAARVKGGKKAATTREAAQA